jgi:phosphoglycolate phosphatase-like HAD superfamily hydrolase
VLLLFDIDGTLLIRAHVEHRLALAEAAREIWGAVDPGPAAVPAAGRTDIEIAREICLLASVTAAHFDDGMPAFGAACARAYAHLAPADLHDRLAPDAQRVLTDLAGRAGVRLSLVTGNLEAVARIKLERSGLAEFFAAGQGGFGSDAEDRTELPAMARRRAGANGKAYPRAHTAVIGDTPNDIACAHADGLRCVAVTTGPFSAHDLRKADRVIAGLRELPALIVRRPHEAATEPTDVMLTLPARTAPPAP